MEKFTADNLILLEFLVDAVNLEFGVQQDLKCLSGVTCVSFQFLDNAPLFVSEEDFTPKKKKDAGCNSIKNGKSCLFALTTKQAEDCLNQFDVFVEVYKKMKPGMMPEKVHIGESLISIVNLFVELVDTVNNNMTGGPVAKTLKDCFKIQDSRGEMVGSISLYIRMSSFGKLIVSQFQMNLQDKNVEFKGNEGHYMFQYGQTPEPCPLPCPPPPCQPLPPCQPSPCSPPCFPPPCSPPPCSPPPCPPTPCSPPAPCACFLRCMQSCSQVPCKPPPTCYQPPPCAPPPCCQPCPPPPCCQPCPPPPKYCTCPSCCPAISTCQPEGAYQEIDAHMGGNSLLIRVHKDTATCESMGDQHPPCSCTEPPCPPPSCCLSTPCCQVPRCGPPCGPPPPGCPPSPCCQPSTLRTACPDPNNPFTLKMGPGCCKPCNNICVAPPASTEPNSSPKTQITSEKELYVLRINKKSEKANKKNNLELELCTPKVPVYKCPPKLEAAGTQCEEDEESGAGGGKKAKKGKK